MGGVWRRRLAGMALGALLVGCGGGSPQDLEDPGPPASPEFDITGSWSSRGGLSEPLTGVSAAVWNGGVFMVGGYADTPAGPATRHVVRIDVATGDRAILADYPDAVAEGALTVYRDTLLMIGGNGGTEASVSVSAAIRWYDESNDRWEEWGALPERRFRHTAHVVGDRLYVIGGRDLTQPPGDSIVVFDGRAAMYGEPPNRTYTEPMVGGVLRDTVFVVTSAAGPRVLRLTEGPEWAEALGNPLDGVATGGPLGERMHAFSAGQNPDHRAWDRTAVAWLTAPPPNNPVERAAVVDVGGTLWLIGGHDRSRDATNRIQIFTPG